MTIDLLPKTTTDAICIHAGTNNTSNNKSIVEITGEMNDLINEIKKKDMVPIISLLITRNDKYSEKVKVINRRMIKLCNVHGINYVQHRNITGSHLNPIGLHLAWQNTHILKDNFAHLFNFAIENNFSFFLMNLYLKLFTI